MIDPYCGPAPVPETLFGAWNLDPVLIAGLVATFGAAFVMLPRSGGHRDRIYLALAFMGAVVAFVSPLCALSTALFSARVAHHVVLVSIVAPLVALALPTPAFMRRLPLGLILAAHVALLCLWHMPGPYAFALSGNLAYWAMELALLASAWAVWQRALDARADAGSSLLLLVATMIAMALIGAILTFARAPLFEPHFTTTLAFGITPLADQQLSGLLMWVPGTVPHLIATVAILLRALDGASPQSSAARMRAPSSARV